MTALINILASNNSTDIIMICIWAIIFLVTLIIEVNTADLTTIWFCISALVTLILSVFKIDFYIQIIIFLVLSITLLLAIRPLTKKMMQQEIIHTNADKVIDMIGVVTKSITKDIIGEVKVINDIWRAITLEEGTIQEGEKVIINSISGNKLVVSKINSNENIEKI